MDSKTIKALLLEYFRFKRSMNCGTEVYTSGIADIVAITKNLKSSYEIEVKISISDLKADFKKHKHKHYLKESSYVYCEYPNYFYYCFPVELLEKAQPLIEEVNKKYGIYVVENNILKLVKKAVRLNKVDNKCLYDNLVNRVTSEIANYYQKQYLTPLRENDKKNKKV